MRISADAVTGVILAGGTSRRMGRNKALLLFRGVPLINRAAAIMQSVFDDVRIITDASPHPEYPPLPRIMDIYPGAGPLGGIQAALSVCTAPALFVLACDMPNVTPALVHHILSTDAAEPIRIVREGDRLHPLCGLYSSTVRTIVEERLRGGRRAMMHFIETAGYAEVPVGPWLPWHTADMLLNLNTPDQLGEAGSGTP